MSEFFAMGGYAAYVWPAYGLSVVAIAGLVYASFAALRAARRAVAALEGGEEGKGS